MTAPPVRCSSCHRSVWLCPGGDGCPTRPDDIHNDAPSCSSSSHLAALARRPSTLLYRGITGDMVQLDCSTCGQRIEIPRAVALRASAPIGLARTRGEKKTAEIKAPTMAELAEDARRGVWR